MRNKTLLPVFIAIVLVWITFSSCQKAVGNQTGSEYMPDMAHSIAYEANTFSYYSLNTWGGEEEYYHYAMPRKPVSGTVPRGYAGMQLDPAHAASIEASLKGDKSIAGIAIPVNGNVPYAYGNTEEQRALAASEVIQNPYPITDQSLANGKELYNIYCGICHGEKADGVGYLVREDGGKYPAQPANLLLDQYVDATNGQYYHAIVYGKNMMGGYADKLSFKERWDVIHYIRSLQAKERKAVYSSTENTLNTWAVPFALTDAAKQVVEHVAPESEGHGEGNHDMDSKMNHGDGHSTGH